MINQKRISRSGSVTIPAHLRRSYGIEGGETVGVAIDSKTGDIKLQRMNGSCLFCDSTENLQQYKGRFVCAACRSAIGKMKEGKNHA